MPNAETADGSVERRAPAAERIAFTPSITRTDPLEHIQFAASATREREADTRRMVGDGTLPSISLSDKAISTESGDVRKALDKTFLGISTPDVAALSRVLGPMSAADRHRLERDYKEHYGTDLRSDLKDKLSPKDYQAQIAILDRVDGKTNLAGSINSALEQTKTDPEAGQRQLRSTLETLSPAALAQLDKEYKGPDGKGKGFLQTILDNPNVSQANRDMVRAMVLGAEPRLAGPKDAAVEVDGKRYAAVGSDRTQSDIVAMADIAVKARDLRMFKDVVGDDTPAARAALKQLQAEPAFVDSYKAAFETGKSASEIKVAEDIRTEGRVSLATILEGNKNVWWGLMDNPGNTDLALSNGTLKEKNDYTRGKELVDLAAKFGTTPEKLATTPELRDSLAYHRKIDAAMDKEATTSDGVIDQVRKSVLRDQLMHGGKTLISELAATDKGGGHTADSIMSVAERMSRQDYDRLHNNPAELAKYQADLQRSLSAYATPDEQARILNMVADKAKAPSYEASLDVKRSVLDVMEDTKSTHWFGRPDTYDNDKVTSRIASMSPEDAQKYRDNTGGFRDKIDKFVSEQLRDSSAQRYLADSTLKQIAQTGKTPTLDAAQQVIKDNLDGADPATRARHMETVLQDKALVEQLKQVEAAKALGGSEMAKRMEDPAFAAAFKLSNALRESAPYMANQITWNMALKDGQIPPGVKLGMGVPMTDLYESFARSPKETRDRTSLSTDQRQILDAVVAQGGKQTLADQLRSFNIGDGGNFQDFRERLAALSPDERQKLKEEYNTKYHSSLDNDFLGKVDAAHMLEYTKLLSSAKSDGVQDFIDRRASADSGGTPADASNLTLDRTVQQNQALLTEYAKMRQALPEDKQRLLDQVFSEAKLQEIQSEKAKAEMIYNGMMAAALVASIPLTAGLSATTLAALSAGGAIAGGVGRVELLKKIEGGNFDDSVSNQLKQYAIGAAEGLLIAGPNLAIKGVKALSPSAIAELKVFSTELRASTTGTDLVVSGSRGAAVAERGAVLAERATPLVAERAAPLVAERSAPLLAERGATPLIAAERTTGRELVVQGGRDVVVKGTGREVAISGSREVAIAERAERGVGAADAARAGARRGPTIIDGEYTVISEGIRTARPIRPIPVPIIERIAPTIPTVLKGAAAADKAAETVVPPKADDRIVPPAVTPSKPTEYQPSEAMIKAATVRRGEGPWQSAERILKADGKPHSIDEVRALTKAIQQVYGKNPNNPDMGSLKVNHNFVKDTAQSYNALINTVTDARVKALLIQFAAR
ncbi:MAG: hypothetical protein JST89_23505 [Cyanobacteria bacterium SZAS-4]|nr:hypothetical protein [Cyanobacteria bacterium SZAS-4]